MRKTLIIILFSPLCLLAQVNSVSPYTLFGVGDLSEGYYLKNMSMGGISAALRDPFFINLANPASLTSLELTSLDIGVSHKYLTQKDQNSGSIVKNTSSYFQYFGLGFKLKPWWGMAISLMPYSQVGYSIFITEKNPDFGETLFSFQGDGGINQVVFGNGFEPVKNLSIGVNFRYLFGNTRKRVSAEFEDPTLYYSRSGEETRVSDISWDVGAQYELMLNRDKDGVAQSSFIFGATLDLKDDINATRSMVDYSYVRVSGNEIAIDTVLFEQGVEGKIVLPTKYTVGIGYGGYNPGKLGHSWMINADYSASKWSDYVDFDGGQVLNDSWRASIGAFFVPAYAFTGGAKRSYFGLIEWRLGGFYENSHITVNNQPVIAQGVSAGFSLPFKPKNLAPGDMKLNNFSFGIIYGSKAAESNTLIQEDYIHLTFGLTLNDLWFQKRKYR